MPALVIGFLIYTAIVLLPHLQTLIAFSQGETWYISARLAWGLLIGNAALVGVWPFIAFVTLIISLSISMALLIEVIVLRSKIVVADKKDIKDFTQMENQKENQSRNRGSIASAFAFVLAFLGYGCAACGTAVSATIFNALGLSFLVTWLPLRGIEFSLLGLVLVFISWRGLVKQIQQLKSPVCL